MVCSITYRRKDECFGSWFLPLDPQEGFCDSHNLGGMDTIHRYHPFIPLIIGIVLHPQIHVVDLGREADFAAEGTRDACSGGDEGIGALQAEGVATRKHTPLKIHTINETQISYCRSNTIPTYYIPPFPSQ